MRKSKLSSRITWRVIGIMSLFNVLIIVVILAFVSVVSIMNSNVRGKYVVDEVEGRLESMLRAIHVGAANNRAEVERNLDSPEQVFAALEQEIQDNSNSIGCFAAFEPNYFKDQGHWFEAYLYHADSTRFKRRQVGSPSHDYFNGVWYKKALNLDRHGMGYLTSPYFDNSVDSGMYCSYVIPIEDRQGRKVGVYGVDLKYFWLDTVIDEIEENVKSEFLNHILNLEDNKGVKLISIQIIDNKGNRIIGSDSLDINILKAEKENVLGDLQMKNLKDTPYYIISKPLAFTDWTVNVIQHRTLVFMWGGILSIFILICMGIGGFVIFLFISRSIHRVTKPLGFLSESTQEVAKGNFDAPLPTFKSNDEVAQLRDSFGTMQQSLKQYVEELKASTAAKASIESELNVAHNIQMSMIPKTFPAFPNRKDIELYASLTPAKAVGGDLYDFFIRDEKLFFCIGDVSGKGVPASLVMAVSRTLFRNITTHSDEPSHIVKTMNVNLCEGNVDCMFVTLFVGVFNLQTGHLHYCNAGHMPPIVINKKPEPLSVNQIAPVGLVEDTPYLTEEVVIEPQTTILLYTDGLNEAMDANGKQFGEDRILDEMSHAIQDSQLSPKAVIDRMTQAVHLFVGDTEQSDDLTMLAFRFIK